MGSYSQHYYSTVIGHVNRAWNNIQSRVSKQRSYRHVSINMSHEEFLEWAIPEYTKWLKSRPDEKPSVDRKDSKGDYEIGNLQLIELNENRTKTKRNKHRFAPKGKLYCPKCEDYLPKVEFYERKSVPLTKTNVRMHWSALCKEHTKEKAKVDWEAKHGKRPEPSGVCERCKKKLKPTEDGKVSRAKHCGSCRARLFQQDNPPDAQHMRDLARERTRRYRERQKAKQA